jgi:TRAP-type C4-dicarboxylate transport system substrate-binding protein
MARGIDQKRGGMAMRRALVFLAVFAVVVCVIGMVSSDKLFAQKKPVVIRLVVPTPEGEWPQTFRDKEMAKRFNERAKGEYVIEVHTGSALAKLPEYFDAVRVGAVDMVASPWGVFAFLDSRFGLLEIPFLLNNNYAVSAACKEMVPLFDQVLQEKFNAKGLALWTTGGLGLWSQKPVKTLKDWKGILVASISPATATMVNGLGGSPVTLPFTDVYEALQKKIVDGAIFGSHGGVVYSFPDICKYFAAFNGVSAFNGYSINLNVWKKMPPHIQQILQEETVRAADWNSNVSMKDLPDMDLKVFKEKGVTVYYIPEEERAKWAKEFEAVKDKQLSAAGELGARIRKIADEANKKYPYSEKGML